MAHDRKVLRTPDERFQYLPDYPFEPCYAEVDGLRIHYVDEGPRDAAPVLMLHGEPSWSYLYRFMIPICAERHRVIAPDLVGFGKSDKPASVSDYTYQSHMDWMRGLVVDTLDLTDITLVCQDWGSLIGLRLAAENEERFARIVVGNGFLPTGDQPFPRAFEIWRAFARFSPIFPIGRIVDKGTRRELTPEERRAYDAPFPSARYKAGARAFPLLVPTSPDNPATPANRKAWEVLERWEKPFLTTFSSGDPITRGADKYLRKRIPGAEGQNHQTLRGGHFLQEDSGPEFAAAVNAL
ncbi:MAG: haloalkane dehalogenase, partial [Holophagales bacterium]|nr:haloalkane dehalogenase [Holophagales bacterium]